MGFTFPRLRAKAVRGVHMYAQWLAANLLGVDAGRVSQPVVRMYNVELLGPCHHSGDDGIVVDFLMEVAGIAPCKLHAAQVVDVHIVEVSVYMVAQLIVKVGRHNVAHTVFNIVIVYITPSNGHRIHSNDARRVLRLITKRMWQAQGYVHIALSMQAFRYPKVSSGKPTEHMRGIFPSKH